MMISLRNLLQKYSRNEEGVAAVEAAFVFPILLILILGTLDMGRGIMSNQKTIKASQVVADLVTRDVMITQSDINEAVQAGTLSLQPYSTASLGFDVISIRFLPDLTPQIVWRETSPNTSEMTMAEITERTTALAQVDGGVVIVAAQYLYEPIFAGFVVNQINMQEIAFARGRKSAVVCMEDAPGC